MRDPETISFADEGFASSTGREFIVEGHTAENRSGLLGAKVVVERQASDEVIELGRKQGLRFDPVFDDAHPSLVLLEAIGQVNFVEHLAKDLAALGYHRLAEKRSLA